MKQKAKHEIAYQNKDILSKILAENFKDKSLKVYGIDIPKIKGTLPTNLPAIWVNEMRLDNLFLLEDGSLALIDYESEVKWTNQVKYLNYITRILERYERDEMPKKIRMIVIYTADVESAPGKFSAGCLTLRMERAFLRKMDPKVIVDKIKRKLKNKKPLSEKDQMKLIILPLIYKGKARKRQAVTEAVELANQIPEEKKRMFVLSGVLVFADKVIDEETAKQIKEAISMTKVEKLILDEGWQRGQQEGWQRGQQDGWQRGQQEGWQKGQQDGWRRGQQDGWQKGRQDERCEGIKTLIASLRSLSIPEDVIVNQLVERYQLNKGEANEFLAQK